MTVTCPFNSKFRENLRSKSSIRMSSASDNKVGVGGQCCESTNRQKPPGWNWKKPDSRCHEHENLILRTRTSLSVPCSQRTHCSPLPAYWCFLSWGIKWEDRMHILSDLGNIRKYKIPAVWDWLIQDLYIEHIFSEIDLCTSLRH